jgi:2-methylcitrate dehydratase PrpD
LNDITDKFIDLIHEYGRCQIPKKTLSIAKLCVLDYLGCAFAGATMQIEQTCELQRWISGEGSVVLLGMSKQCSPMSAILINAMNAHKAELDDGHRFAMLHPGAPIISALLAVSIEEKFDGGSFIRGVIGGYEASIRLGKAIQPAHKMRGGHASGTCGCIGAATAISIALGFDKAQLKNAIAAAATGASGLLEMIDDSSQLKPFNIGHAALSGYVSAYIGKSGFPGPQDSLGGKRGFMRFMADEKYDESHLSVKDSTHRIEEVYFKPYAACRHSHAAIDAVLKLTDEYEILPERIANIVVKTYRLAVVGHDHVEITSEASAKMSIPFSVATAIVNKRAGLQEFNENAIKDTSVIELTKRVKVLEDKELTEISPERRVAIVQIQDITGETLEQRVDFPLGEPENPMSPNDIEDKFITLATAVGLSKHQVSRIINTTRILESDFPEWIKAISV